MWDQLERNTKARIILPEVITIHTVWRYSGAPLLKTVTIN